MRISVLALALPLAFTAACGSAQTGNGAPAPQSTGPAPTETAGPFGIASLGTFDEPWAMAFAPGTQVVFVTEKAGTMKFVDIPSGRVGTVSGLPQVAYGGQGGLGDVAFLPSESSSTLDRRTIYLTWVEPGDGDTRGAVMGRGTLVCQEADACRIDGLEVIWRQQPKLDGYAHYSHRIAFSPDGQHLFLASGERAKGDPAQDLSNNMGSILRLNLDGTPAANNPFAERGGVSREIWTYGNRNILGLEFDSSGRLWGLEHGPAGGDELNLLERGKNYGWPVVSYGDHYNGDPIPSHETRPEFEQPAIQWTPVIAPGDFIFYSGDMFPDWRGDALIAGLKTQAIIRVEIDGEDATEVARYPMSDRLRDIEQAPDGALVVIEDGEDGRLLRLTLAN